MLLNRGVNKIGGVKQPTFGNGLSNKGIAAGKHPHNDGLGATTTKRGPRPAALIETTQPPTNGSCLPKPPTIGNYSPWTTGTLAAGVVRAVQIESGGSVRCYLRLLFAPQLCSFLFHSPISYLKKGAEPCHSGNQSLSFTGLPRGLRPKLPHRSTHLTGLS